MADDNDEFPPPVEVPPLPFYPDDDEFYLFDDERKPAQEVDPSTLGPAQKRAWETQQKLYAIMNAPRDEDIERIVGIIERIWMRRPGNGRAIVDAIQKKKSGGEWKELPPQILSAMTPDSVFGIAAHEPEVFDDILKLFEISDEELRGMALEKIGKWAPSLPEVAEILRRHKGLYLSYAEPEVAQAVDAGIAAYLLYFRDLTPEGDAVSPIAAAPQACGMAPERFAEVVRECILKAMQSGDGKRALCIHEICHVSPENMALDSAELVAGLGGLMRPGDFASARQIIEGLHIAQETYQNPAVQAAVVEHLPHCWNMNGDFEEMRSYKEFFGISDAAFRPILLLIVGQYVQNDDRLRQLREILPCNDDDVQEAAERVLIQQATDKYYYRNILTHHMSTVKRYGHPGILDEQTWHRLLPYSWGENPLAYMVALALLKPKDVQSPQLIKELRAALGREGTIDIATIMRIPDATLEALEPDYPVRAYRDLVGEPYDNIFRLFAKLHQEENGPEKTSAFAAKVRDILAQLQDISPHAREIVIGQMERLVAIPSDRLPAYITVLLRIEQCPSQSVQRVKKEIMEQIMATDDPIVTYAKVEEVFVSNNLPDAGKVLRVFLILHNNETLEQNTTGYLSPRLRKESVNARRIQSLLYADLVKIHADSGNGSLRVFLQFLEQSDRHLAAVAEAKDASLLSEEQLQRAALALVKMRTLLRQSGLSTAHDPDSGPQPKDRSALREWILAEEELLRRQLNVPEGGTLYGRVADMFLRPLQPDAADADHRSHGVALGQAVLDRMEQKRWEADARGRALAREGLALREGDLLKGTEAKYLWNILENGSVAKEFLGSDASSDSTPLDTDVSRVRDASINLASAIAASGSSNYGNIIFVVRDRGQFHLTDATTTQFENKRYELFQTGIIGDQHYGIRTGFASTEIDAIVVDDLLAANGRDVRELFFTIAKKGCYIPVYDQKNSLIFTPEHYDDLRRTFAGITRFGGGDYPVVRHSALEENVPAYARDIADWMEKITQEEQETAVVKDAIVSKLTVTLGKLGIPLAPGFVESMAVSSLLDIGSTGRGTQMPGEARDFDFTLRLDDVQPHQGGQSPFKQLDKIVQALRDALGGEDNISHADENGGYQLRLKGATAIPGNPDIDIAFVRNSELMAYGSHDAVSERLNAIADPTERRRVIANIVLAKKVLKEAGVYKKLDGGIGGIGVENWILLHGGNFLEACRTFLAAAQQDGRVLNLSEFRSNYPLRDPGINVKFGKHDDFVDLLKPDGYAKMLSALRVYCNLPGKATPPDEQAEG